MDEHERQRLSTILDHEFDLARRNFEEDLKVLYADLAASGMLHSGMRVRKAITLIDDTLHAFADAAIASAQEAALSPGAFEMAERCTVGLLEIFRRRLPEIVFPPDGDPGAKGPRSDEFRRASKLFNATAPILTSKLKNASSKFQGGPAVVGTSQAHFDLGAAIATTVPNGFLPLGEVLFELVEAVYTAAKVGSHAPNKAYDETEAKADWLARIRLNRHVRHIVQQAIQRSRDHAALPVWTRSGPGVAPEELDWYLLAGTTSLDWNGTLVAGRLIVLSDSALRPLDRWPLFVKPPDWKLVCKVVMDSVVPGVAGKRRLPEAQLGSWWSSLSVGERALSQNALWNLAKAKFPGHSIARDRIRGLTPDRMSGPRPIGEKSTAE